MTSKVLLSSRSIRNQLNKCDILQKFHKGILGYIFSFNSPSWYTELCKIQSQ